MGLLFFVAKHDGCFLNEVERARLEERRRHGPDLAARADGVIRRKASTEDRRAAQLFLTPKGRRQLDEVRKLNDDLNTALREGF